MLMTENKRARRMTEFGRTLNKLMVHHDVYSWQALRDELERVGYDIGQSRLSQYLYGDRNPQEPQRFFDALSAALGLSEEEEMRLAYSFAYPEGGPSQRLTAENVERAREFEEQIKNRKGEVDEGQERPAAGGRGV